MIYQNIRDSESPTDIEVHDTDQPIGTDRLVAAAGLLLSWLMSALETKPEAQEKVEGDDGR